MGYMKTNTAVIGGGASGLTAAVGCSRLSGKGSVLIIEKQQRTATAQASLEAADIDRPHSH